MKLLNTEDYSPAEGAIVFRQSRFIMAFGSLVMIAIFGGIPFLCITLKLPRIILWITLLFAIFVIPIFLTTIAGVFRKSNWVMAIEQNSLWVNLRTFTAYKYPPAETVVRMEFEEIESVTPCRIEIQLPRLNDDSPQKRIEESLLIEFNHDRTDELKQAVREENNRREEKKFLFGLGTSRTKIGNSHAHMKTDRLMKIVWTGTNGSICIRPKLREATRELSHYVKVGEPVNKIPRSDSDESETDDRSESENEILQLIESGDKMTAVKLARQVYGFGLKEAKEFVEELEMDG